MADRDKDGANFWIKFTFLITIFLGIIFQLIAFIFKGYIRQLDDVKASVSRVEQKIGELDKYMQGEKAEWEFIKRNYGIGSVKNAQEVFRDRRN